ncbi:hypothetical protein RIF29_40268 [Crotalaria pallida]|uniref:TIR domain-containing protein n=1 Tax=Crotalaria pallida TaxID=3830 RepID=A0AAN9E956_CROPI
MASSSCTKAYDVFISFRGEDTRRSFTSHLHSALCKASINTYIDDDSLAKGDSVWPALRGAIENSRIAVVIFSINYATSKWCLEELIKILECRKLEGQVVIPVFYEVDPSHVRNRTGSYGEAFAKHEEKGFDGKDDEYVEKKVYEWKTALTEAANISGWDSRSYGYKDAVSSDLMEELDLKDLRIEELHSSIGFLHGLRSLKLDGSDVKRLPESIKHLEKLKVLSLKNCEKLQCLPELPPSIESLSAVNCSSLVKVSTLQTLVGCRDYVFISFQNCEKLDRPLLNSIMDDTLLRMAVVDTNATWNADEKRILKHSVFEMVSAIELSLHDAEEQVLIFRTR